MKKVRIDELDRFFGPATVKRQVGDALGAEAVALNYYELEQGDSFGFGYHRHPAQEEVFYVREGTVTFETENGDVEVGSGEVVRFAPGEFQRGTNRGDEPVVAVALGAPKAESDADVYRECADCGERTLQDFEMTDDRDAIVTLCADCGAETGRFQYGRIE